MLLLPGMSVTHETSHRAAPARLRTPPQAAVTPVHHENPAVFQTRRLGLTDGEGAP